MRYLYVCLTFFFVQHVSAQEIQQQVKKERLKNFYIAPSVGFEMMSIKNYEEEVNKYTISYQGSPSLRMGFDIAYKHNANLVINTGIFYSNKNFDRTEVCEECATDYYYKSSYKNRYFETLLGGTYNFVVGRLDVGFYTNLNFSFLHIAKEIRETETGNSFTFNTKANQRKVLTVVEPGLNFNFNLTYRLSLGLKAGYRLYTGSLTNAGTYKNSGVLIQPGLFYMF